MYMPDYLFNKPGISNFPYLAPYLTQNVTDDNGIRIIENGIAFNQCIIKLVFF